MKYVHRRCGLRASWADWGSIGVQNTRFSLGDSFHKNCVAIKLDETREILYRQRSWHRQSQRKCAYNIIRGRANQPRSEARLSPLSGLSVFSVPTFFETKPSPNVKSDTVDHSTYGIQVKKTIESTRDLILTLSCSVVARSLPDMITYLLYSLIMIGWRCITSRSSTTSFWKEESHSDDDESPYFDVTARRHCSSVSRGPDGW